VIAAVIWPGGRPGGAVGFPAQEPGQVRRAHLGAGRAHLRDGDAGRVFRHGDHVHRAGQRGGLVLAELPCAVRLFGGGFGSLGVHELGPTGVSDGEDVLFGVELACGGVPVAARRGVDGLPVAGRVPR
jgi:hypothetical protein